MTCPPVRPGDRFVRWSKSLYQAQSWLLEASLWSPAEPIPAALWERTQALMGAVNGRVSVYLSEGESPRSLGHAMAVLGVCLGSDDFRSGQKEGELRKRVRAKKGATVLLSAAVIEASCSVEYSPQRCHTLWVAAPFHWDVCYGPGCRQQDQERVGEAWCALASVGAVSLVAVQPVVEEQVACEPFDGQARVVVRHCIDHHGLWGEPDPAWRDGQRLSAAEQIERLRALARLLGLGPPPSP